MKLLLAFSLAALAAGSWILVSSSKTEFTFSLTEHRFSASVKNEGHPKPSAPPMSQGSPTGGAAPLDGSMAPNESAQRPVLGVRAASVTPEMVAQFRLPVTEGAVVMQVTPNSPAADAGLRPDDIITQAGGSEIATSTDLVGVVRSSEVGRQFVLRVWRGSRSFICVVYLGTAPEPLRPSLADGGLGG